MTVLNQTSALGLNLGSTFPCVLRKLTSIDLSTSAFPYLGYREAEVCRCAVRLFRIGFVGELGYEIHCPSASRARLDSLV